MRVFLSHYKFSTRERYYRNIGIEKKERKILFIFQLNKIFMNYYGHKQWPVTASGVPDNPTTIFYREIQCKC